MTASIRVEGLSRTIGQLKKLGVESSDLKEAWQPVGRDVVERARKWTPMQKDGGALRESVRASKRQNGVTIRAGYAGRVSYAQYVHWGASTQPGPRPFIKIGVSEVDIDGEILQALDLAIRTSGLAP